MLTMVTAAGDASAVRKGYSDFVYGGVEPHAVFAMYKLTRRLCVLQWILMKLVGPALLGLPMFCNIYC